MIYSVSAVVPKMIPSVPGCEQFPVATITAQDLYDPLLRCRLSPPARVFKFDSRLSTSPSEVTVPDGRLAASVGDSCDNSRVFMIPFVSSERHVYTSSEKYPHPEISTITLLSCHGTHKIFSCPNSHCARSANATLPLGPHLSDM